MFTLDIYMVVSEYRSTACFLKLLAISPVYPNTSSTVATWVASIRIRISKSSYLGEVLVVEKYKHCEHKT